VTGIYRLEQYNIACCYATLGQERIGPPLLWSLGSFSKWNARDKIACCYATLGQARLAFFFFSDLPGMAVEA
jgi:hypothetical protein